MTTPNQVLSADEMTLIYRCLLAAESGPFFPDWEFKTLFGIERSELGEVLARWPKVSLDEDVVYLSVMNTVPLLLEYPHGEEDVLCKYVPEGLSKMEQLYNRLEILDRLGRLRSTHSKSK